MISVLTFNSILYIFLLYKYWKSTNFSLPFILMGFYSFVAIMGIIVFQTGIYQTVMTINVTSVSLIPYILCFFCVAVLIYPLRKVYYNNIRFEDIPYNRTTNFFINMWIINTIIYFFLKIYEWSIVSVLGFGEIYYTASVEGSLSELLYRGNMFLYKFNNFNVNLSYSFTPFVFSYVLYGLIKHKIIKRRAYFIIGLVCIINIISALAKGSRGHLFFTFWSLLFYITIFFNQFNKMMRKKIIVGTLLLLFVLLLYSALISVSRITNSTTAVETPLTSVLRYFGEAFPNLSNLFWEQVKHHPDGTRLFPYLFGDKYSAISVQDGYSYWQSYTGVPVLCFKTIYGDLYIEFGVIIPLFIIGTLSLVFKTFIGNRKISFWKISFIYWYFDLVLQGVFGFNKAGNSNLIVFIAIFLVSFIVKIYTSKQKRHIGRI